MGKRLGTFRAFFTVAIACVGSFMFAYDTGIIGGILALESFQTDFRYTAAQKATVASNSNTFFACFFAWPFTSKYGRRWTLVLAAVIFNVGAVIQTINTHHIGGFYAARVISGLGVGVATVVMPMYAAEMAPKAIRGMLGSMMQLFFTLGVMTSYWIDYGVAEHMGPVSAQWQIPIGLQLVPGSILGLGMLFSQESTRWLAMKGRLDEGLASLRWIRGGDSPEVEEEWAEILQWIEEEKRMKAGVTWRELLQPLNRLRIGLIISLQAGVQLTGNTSLAYYAPQIFTLVGAGKNSFLFTGFFGFVKVVACSFFLLVLVERIGRRGALLLGATLMGTYMLIVAILGAKFPTTPTSGLSPPAIASLTMIYLEAMAYNISWGAVSWIYIGEMFPNRIRESGVAIGMATQWLFNFAFSFITPHAVQNLGWKTFLMFAIFNFSLVAYVYIFILETKGRSLEEMESLFAEKFKRWLPAVESSDTEAFTDDKAPEARSTEGQSVDNKKGE
ncbi:related to quinate transport protein [Cephalotrichum gorgonifer]|uniref:Related to quinate transport protein n=1 Tax=Cephalotrichum gorgonifer TaxID=2041049 RepID=A0AAE8N3E5_9PEZI|nr:related to quinate transport protein [Cephalotrichum gorgonifer]